MATLGAVAPAAEAAAGPVFPCGQGATYHVSTSRGTPVWVPSNRSAGPFQFGGSQSLSSADGRMKATTKGSARTLSGGTGVKLGPVEASARYDQQWNRSATATSSFVSTFTTTSPTMKRSVNWRWRMYVRGYNFTVRGWCHRPAFVVGQGTVGTWTLVRRDVVVPATRRDTTFAVETYQKRDWILGMNGKPLKKVG